MTSTTTEEERAEYARLRNAIDYGEQYGFERSAPKSSTGSSTRRRSPSEKHRCSPSKRPRHHEGELFSPKSAAVRAGALHHDDMRACIAQRASPPRRVVEEELLLRAGDEVEAGKRRRHHR